LLSNFFQVENIAFVNQFYKQTLIKKRIIMMKKNQSKKMNQLKYLLLIPVLASMLFYTSCASKASLNKLKESERVSQERLRVKNIELGNKILENNILKDSINKLKLARVRSFKKSVYKDGDDVSFMIIDIVPTFPGCEEGDKKCFSKMVQKHFSKNFDAKMVNTLGLESGRKRVFIGFKIDEEGTVVDVKARAPHQKIKDEVIRVMSTLPKMIPGEHKGKKVVVKYSIPFTLNVD